VTDLPSLLQESCGRIRMTVTAWKGPPPEFRQGSALESPVR
jgi:hypothetical protein